MKHVNIDIKTFSHGVSDDEMNFTFDTFWIDYIDFNTIMVPFMVVISYG